VSRSVLSLPAAPGTSLGRFVASRRRRLPVLLVVPALVAVTVSLLPIWYLIDRAFEQGAPAVVGEIWQRRTFDLVVRSLSLAVFVTGACVVVGVTAAWLVARSDLPGRRVLQVLFALPLAIPSYVAAYAWVSWKPWLAGFRGAALVLTLASYPYVYLPVVAALKRLDPAQEEIARSLGRSPLRVALGLTIRQVRPAIVAGALLVMLYVLSDFGAVATMRYEVFTWVIFGAYRAGFNPSRAAILALVLVATALVIVAFETKVRGSRAYSRVGSGAPRPQRPIALGRARPLAYAFVGLVLGAGIVFPVASVVYWLQRGASTTFEIGELTSALWGTVRVSGLAALAAVALAVPVGVLAARYRSRSAHVIERSTYVAHALPGIVVAISLVFVGVRLLRPIYQEIPLLVLAYVVLFLPLAVGAVRTSVEQSPVRLEEVARSLGHSPRRVLARVTVPLALPGIGAGAAMVFLTAMKELPATLLLRPTGMETLATRLWRYTSVSDFASAGPYAVALMLVAALPTALLGGALAARIGRSDGPPS
jgi:iron(III) transport system permease protein